VIVAQVLGPRFDLVLLDGTRVSLDGDLTIGRSTDNAVRLSDPAVSRHHARISIDGGAAVLQDVGSTHGTWLDGKRMDGTRTPLRDGSRIRIGDQELLVERQRTSAEAGRTIVVPPGAPGVTPAVDDSGELRPRLRSGYALKRRDASEGSRRWVLRDLRSDKFLRLSDDDAELLDLLDGTRTLPQLLQAAGQRAGDSGPVHLARLLAELEDRSLLAGEGEGESEGEDASQALLPAGRLRRWLRPRRASWNGAAELFERLYRRGGWLLFTRPALVTLAALALLGAGVFCALVVGRYGTPFVVAQRIGAGALVFLLGRFVLVVCHELAHGLALTAVGRRVGALGVMRVLIFPYAYVDTSEAWLEPRRRRILVSAAGPASDVTLGAVFSVVCLYLPAGTVRDIVFQLALAAYVGALFNLNPFLDRDGYQIIVDILGVPGLRRRAQDQLARRVGGAGASASDSRALTWYAVAGLAWSVAAACFAAGMALRYVRALESVAPAPVVWGVLAALWVCLLIPAGVTLVGPLLARIRARPIA
jgi:putative peptide zinc metalloprotease protein